MGTNFYTLNGRHIGKRSAAGMYCWDCGITLCKGGEKKVHHSSAQSIDFKEMIAANKRDNYSACPKCGKKRIKEDVENSSVGRELGFNKNTPKKKTGVSSCSSFTWARHLNKKWKGVRDEYRRKFTMEQFEKILEECPIRFFDYIGQEFS
jgi:hypothetical protein